MADGLMSVEKFIDFFAYTKNPPSPEQRIGIENLWHALRQQSPDLLHEQHIWVAEWRKQPKADPTLLRPDSPFDFRISKNFTYGELTLNEEERRFTNQGQCDIANLLCQFLELAREQFGPLKITSGHRPPAINAAVGGASSSEHLFQPGCGAVDVYPLSGDGAAFEKWVDQNWPYSVGYGMSYRQFTHIGIRAGKPRVRWDY